MSFVVLYDTSALFGNTSRDLLVRVAMARLVEAKWTDRILDELHAALAERYGLSEERQIGRRQRMNRANPDGRVTGYEDLMPDLKLRDPNDKHVLAAAIQCGAQVIVAEDKDFTADVLAEWNIERKTPDDFILDLYDLQPGEVYGCVQQIALSRTRLPQRVASSAERSSRSV
jgi:predicted nucleic acid-binding protein